MIYKHQTWFNIEADCHTLYNKIQISDFKPEIIVGLMRGGIIPARILADFFHVRLDFYTIDVKYYTGVNQTLEHPVIRKLDDFDYGKNMLIVDDIYDSGKTMQAVLKVLPTKNIRTATLHNRENNVVTPDFFANIAFQHEWIIYPWEKTEFKKSPENDK
jgi:hypoxanthine phosphoribosyltransferase